MTNITVIALDLEGTLISNAMSQIPRPHLFNFLVACKDLAERVVIFTAVRETLFRKIANTLVAENFAPKWFIDIEFIHWDGDFKDLRFIPNIEVWNGILVDDLESYVHPKQKSQWISIEAFDPPYSSEDQHLLVILENIKKRVNASYN